MLTRDVHRNEASVREAIRYSTIDSTVSLSLAFFVNAAILIVAAATFHKNGYTQVATIEDAYQLLNPLLHSKASAILFGVALLGMCTIY